jgi:hypothetical protein
MKTIFDNAQRGALIARVQRVNVESRPRWGKMNVEQMFAHLVQSMRMAAGELETKPRNLPIRFPPLRQLVVYWMPWPKGTPTAPELLPAERRALDDSKRQLLRLIDDVGARGKQTHWPYHPAFGNLGRRGWGVLGWRHLDHHLRQFGV